MTKSVTAQMVAVVLIAVFLFTETLNLLNIASDLAVVGGLVLLVAQGFVYYELWQYFSGKIKDEYWINSRGRS